MASFVRTLRRIPPPREPPHSRLLSSCSPPTCPHHFAACSRPRFLPPLPVCPKHIRYRHAAAAAAADTSASSLASAAHNADKSDKPPIVILGAGLSGLTIALELSRSLPPTRRIVVLEAQDRPGGWIQSDYVQDRVLLEAGPRSIRPKGFSGWKMLELVHSLGLIERNRLIVVPSSAPSAKNRYVWYGEQLNKLPSSLPAFLAAVFRLPVLRSLLPSALPALLREPSIPSPFVRPKSESEAEVARQRSREHLQDESVQSFILRRFGPAFGGRLLDNLLSAVLHGIYAADTRALSVRSTLPFLWETERRHGSLLRAAFLPAKWNQRYRAPEASEVQRTQAEEDEISRIKQSLPEEYRRQLETASVYSFKEGVQELVGAMMRELERRPNVEVRLGQHVEALQPQQQASKGAAGAAGAAIVEVYTAPSSRQQQPPTPTPTQAPLLASRIISALPSPTLARLLGETLPQRTAALLQYNPSTSVAVVNVAIPSDAVAESGQGATCAFLEARQGGADPGQEGAFGFLVPRNDPHNAAGVLGVVFDSDAIPGQDRVPASASASAGNTPTQKDEDGGGARAYTKLTVMLGGPHFSSGRLSPPPLSADTDTDTDETALRNAASAALERHLCMPPSVLAHPRTVLRTALQRECIPTYKPGHYARMRALHEDLARLAGEGLPLPLPLTVCGASYTGVSLNDIVRSGSEVARRIADAETKSRSGAAVVTGLEAFTA